MEELSQLASFFVANPYLEKKNDSVRPWGVISCWEVTTLYTNYQIPDVAWFQSNQMINIWLFEDWEKYFSDCIFINVTRFIVTEILRLTLEEKGF